MQAAMERIGRYCTGLDFAAFCHNELIIDGVVRNMQVIGEAAKKVPSAVQDLATIWRVATEHLPQNYPDLLRALAAGRRRLTVAE